MSTNALITFIEGQKIKASETNANNNYLLDEINRKIEMLRGEIAKQFEDFQATVSSGSLGIGDIKIAVYDTIPANFLVCNGASLLIEEYKDLYDKIGGLYGQEDVLHFNLPDFRDKVPEGFKETSEPFGSYQQGKAPNIKGTYTGGCAAWHVENGAFSFEGYGAGVFPGNGRTVAITTGTLNASKSSNVYSDSVERITVDRLKVNYLIKYKN